MSPSVPPTDTLLSHFESLEDPHTGYLIEHRMVDMVALIHLCGDKAKAVPARA